MIGRLVGWLVASSFESGVFLHPGKTTHVSSVGAA